MNTPFVTIHNPAPPPSESILEIGPWLPSSFSGGFHTLPGVLVKHVLRPVPVVNVPVKNQHPEIHKNIISTL